MEEREIIKEIVEALKEISEDERKLVLAFIPTVIEKDNQLFYKKFGYMLNLETLEVFYENSGKPSNNNYVKEQLIQSVVQESKQWLVKEIEVLDEINKLHDEFQKLKNKAFNEGLNKNQKP